MTNNPSLPRTIVESLDKEVRNQLELVAAMTHPGESGRARENVIAGFLRKLVPASFSIDTGFVIDSQGSISRQIDIVIYRTDYHPVFEIGGVKHFLVESVAAVLENKAQIASERELDAALQNIASVKKLDRTSGGRNTIIRAGIAGARVDPHKFEHQVFGAIVTQQSMSKDGLIAKLQDFLKGNDRREWFNLYVDVNSFSVYYLRARRDNDDAPGQYSSVFTTVPSDAEELFISDPGASGPPPLADLAQELVNFLRVASLVDFLPTSYLWTEAKGRRYPISTPDRRTQ